MIVTALAQAIEDEARDGPTPSNLQHSVSKHLQQGLESDHFHVKKNMPKIGGFQSFATAKRTIAGFEAMLWLTKGFGFAGEWTVRRQNELLAPCFGFQTVNNPRKSAVLLGRPGCGFATSPPEQPGGEFPSTDEATRKDHETVRVGETSAALPVDSRSARQSFSPPAPGTSDRKHSPRSSRDSARRMA